MIPVRSKMNFSVSKEDEIKLKRWLDRHDKKCPIATPEKCGTIGERLTYSFTPTSLGTVTKVSCGCKEEIDLTDYYGW